MKPCPLFKVSVFFFLFSTLALHADWQWENDLSLAKLTPKGYEAHLFFQNTGKKDVTVAGLAFSCPCTIYHFTATTAKPGETGILTVLIEREGEELQGKDLEVIVFGSEPTRPCELTIRIEMTGAGK